MLNIIEILHVHNKTDMHSRSHAQVNNTDDIFIDVILWHDYLFTMTGVTSTVAMSSGVGADANDTNPHQVASSHNCSTNSDLW